MIYPNNLTEKTIDFTTNFILESVEFYLVEISCKSFSSLRWLMIDKLTLAIQPLQLTAKDSSNQVEECFFEEGYLKFNINNGTFIKKFNSAQYQLLNKLNELNGSLYEAIQSFIYLTPLQNNFPHHTNFLSLTS